MGLTETHKKKQHIQISLEELKERLSSGEICAFRNYKNKKYSGKTIFLVPNEKMSNDFYYIDKFDGDERDGIIIAKDIDSWFNYYKHNNKVAIRYD